MFEEMRFENILNRALSNVSNDFDKRQGSIIYDALAPCCLELAQMYVALDVFLNETFADTASREYLILRAAERGLKPKEATNAVVLAEMTGDFVLEEGARFNCDELNFVYTGEQDENDYYCLRCETRGTVGNLTYGTLIPIDNVKGLETAEIVGINVSARDEETTEDFRKRYFESFESQAFGGNRKDYYEKLKALNDVEEIYNAGGIGGVKLYRTPNGGGTVEVVLTNNSNEKPTKELVELVQTSVDPTINSGDGVGFAPIGHSVTVSGVSEEVVDFDLTVELETGYVVDDVKTAIENILEDYLKSLRENWEGNENIIVYKFVAGSEVLKVGGIKNVVDIKLNNSAADIVVDKNSIPIGGNVNAKAD